MHEQLKEYMVTWRQAAAQDRHVELAVDGPCLVEGKMRLSRENKTKKVEEQSRQMIWV